MPQVLFSSHHTLHDYPDNQGILSMDGFLQACQVSRSYDYYARADVVNDQHILSHGR